jgi:hypothetical protein
MSFSKIAATLLLSGLSITACSAGPVSDDELKVALIGSWVTPPDSGSAASLIPSRQVFLDDGTTTLFIYTNAECRVPAAAIEGRWSIHNGVLSTQITRTTDPRLIEIGQVQQVVIVEVEAGRVVFDADDELFVREKSDTCFPPGAHRT